MLNENTIIRVINREGGVVGYKIPDMNNLTRTFQPHEDKKVPMEELRRLSWTPGGMALLKECLIIDNEEALEELLGVVEPEYYYTEKDITKLLTYGTLDQFMDFLDFAPQGAISIMKDLAIKLELNDVKKREIILEKLGFNINNAIAIEKATAAEMPVEEPKSNRRSAPINAESAKPVNPTSEAPVRRTTAAPKYTTKAFNKE